MTNLHISRSIGTLVAGALAVTACSDLGGPPAGHVEEPGTPLVTTEAAFVYPFWSKDGSEVFYVKADAVGSGTEVAAVNVSTLATRRIYSAPSILEATRASNGEDIYLSAYTSSGQGVQVRRVDATTGAADAITTLLFSYDNHIEVSADEQFMAGSSTLYSLQTGAARTLGQGRPGGFSADGTQLLYYPSYATAPELISTVDGTSIQLQPSDLFYAAHRWVGNSPQLLSYDFTPRADRAYEITLLETDGITGEMRTVARFNGSYSSPTAAWSPDGSALAVWISEGSIVDRTDRQTLYVVREGLSPVSVASIHGDGGPLAFSPSGKSIAYFYAKTLYLVPGI